MDDSTDLEAVADEVRESTLTYMNARDDSILAGVDSVEIQSEDDGLVAVFYVETVEDRRYSVLIREEG